ncbi:hypothetical protein MRB53_027827 [Persea americana]|uniref:Uncharacterized protein n=1 Tax=Persea americana TaxID=3435 RepID=A0ACC2KDW3_PERAE|nr:hypothetical protein MRB53_027827 [Persea americana]
MPEVEDPNLFGDEIDEEEEDEEYEDEIYDDEEEEKPKPQLHKRKHEEEEAAAHAEKPPIPQNPNPNFSSAIVVSAVHSLSSPDHKHQKTSSASAAATAADVEDSRRIFQRLWTDEDEIGLLRGFLDYTSERRRRGGRGGSTNYDTGPFYDQMKTRFHLDFNKNQLVEKLRRLKKKYRNVVNRMASAKDFSFKTPHEQMTFELSRKIWSNSPLDDAKEDRNGHFNAAEMKTQKNSDDPGAAPAEMDDILPEFTTPVTPPAPGSVPSVIEDAVRSCLSPLFKELLSCAMSGPSNLGVGGVALNPLPLNLGGNSAHLMGGGVALNPLPLNFGGNSVNLTGSEAVDERWRKQQILELEVYSKRLELVQEQIKLALEELKSVGS